MKFKVTVTEERLCRARKTPDLVMLGLCDFVTPGEYVVKWAYEAMRHQTTFWGELPDTPEAQRAVTELMALAQGHELPEEPACP